MAAAIENDASLHRCLLKHTWLVHKLTVFQYPLVGDKTSWIAQQITSAARQSSYAAIRSTTNNNKATRRLRSNVQSTYAIVKWLETPVLISHISKKDFTAATRVDCHLLIQLYINDDISAEMMLCFADISYNDDDDKSDKFNVEGFSYCMTRGGKSVAVLFDCLEEMTACQVYRDAHCFTSPEMATLVACWTRYEKKHPDVTVTNLTNVTTAAAAVKTKSLLLTFATPQVVAKAGLDTISIAVLPSSLERLLDCIDNHPSRGNQSVLQALCTFLKEVFAMDVTTFQISKVECRLATCDDSGQVKFITAAAVTYVMNSIRTLFR